jgi:multidrug efflux pump subunit AcrB
MLAIPMGVSGVLMILLVHAHDPERDVAHGRADACRHCNSNSILIVDFAHRLEEQGMSVMDAVITAAGCACGRS